MLAATVAVLATVAAVIALVMADAGPQRPPAAVEASGQAVSSAAMPSSDVPDVPDAASMANRRAGSVAAEALQAVALEPNAEAPWPAAASGPADSDQAEFPRQPRPGSERALYQHFVVIAGQPGGGLAELAPSVFAPGHADAERVALLRALRDTGSPEAGTWFAHALRLPPDPDARVTGHASLPEFALSDLATRGAREPAAVALLAECVSAREIPPDLRRRAAATVAQFGTPPQLRRLGADLAAEADDDWAAAVRAALRGNENAAAAAGYFPAWPDTGVASAGESLPPD